MTIRMLTIPDDQMAWPDWLEQQLVGVHLHELIEELQIANAAASREQSENLNDILTSEQLTFIAESGLRVLETSQIQRLLSDPEALLGLQEHVLINGGDYWQTILLGTLATNSLDRIRSRLLTHEDTNASFPLQGPGEKMAGWTSRRVAGWVVSVVVMLLVGVFAWRSQPHSSGHVLGTPGLLASNTISSEDYLRRISDAGETWFQQDRSSTAALVTLLEDTSHDCQILIDARHSILSPDERDWFVGKCRNWKAAFDETLASLRDGSITLEVARDRSDLTMMKLVSVLRTGPEV